MLSMQEALVLCWTGDVNCHLPEHAEREVFGPGWWALGVRARFWLGKFRRYGGCCLQTSTCRNGHGAHVGRDGRGEERASWGAAKGQILVSIAGQDQLGPEPNCSVLCCRDLV